MQLTLRDVGNVDPEEYAKYNISADEEIMIYGFIVRIVTELNLLDFFESFKQYVKANNLTVLDSFTFTRWMMEHERLAVQDVGVISNIDALRKFDTFQEQWLAEQMREHFKDAPDVMESLGLTQPSTT